MMSEAMFVLLVTWFYYGQPPNSYQVAFATTDACELARAQVLADAKRLNDEAIIKSQPQRQSTGMVTMTNYIAPTVSAVCIAK